MDDEFTALEEFEEALFHNLQSNPEHVGDRDRLRRLERERDSLLQTCKHLRASSHRFRVRSFAVEMKRATCLRLYHEAGQRFLVSRPSAARRDHLKSRLDAARRNFDTADTEHRAVCAAEIEAKQHLRKIQNRVCVVEAMLDELQCRLTRYVQDARYYLETMAKAKVHHELASSYLDYDLSNDEDTLAAAKSFEQ